MKILGISCYFHDSAACIIDNGNIIAACQEERFSRKKNDDKDNVDGWLEIMMNGFKRVLLVYTGSMLFQIPPLLKTIFYSSGLYDFY